MKRILITAFCFAALPFLSSLSALADEWRRFEGAWFAADAPSAFTVNVVANAVADDGPMTVRFTAPDGDVAFFIHAPLWAAPTSETGGADGDTLLGERTTTTGRTRTTWRTWRDQSSGKQRSYRIVQENDGATLTVYGIEYASAEALTKWRPAYLRFLKSVERFAD